MSSVKSYKANGILPGKATGHAVVMKERLGFRGFVNIEEGTFTRAMSELEGVSFAGAVLIFPSSKGSTTWTITLDKTCRYGNSPAAIVNSKLDEFVVLGCAIQDIPLVLIEDLSVFNQLKNGDKITVDADKGEVIVD